MKNNIKVSVKNEDYRIKDNTVVLKDVFQYPIFLNRVLADIWKKKGFIKKVKSNLYPELYMLTKKGIEECKKEL